MNTKNTPFANGKNIFLRGITLSDATELYLSWLNDFEVINTLETKVFPSTIEELKKYLANIIKSSNDVMLAIIVKDSNKHIGNIKLGSINWIHRYCDLGIMIGDKSYWKKGYGTEACSLMLEYAFERLNLHRVYLGAYSDHINSINLYKRVGFQIEGTRRKQLFRDGKYFDEILMGIINEEYFALKNNQ